MTLTFAQKLMARPLQARWIKCMSKGNAKMVAGLLKSIDGDYVVITQDPTSKQKFADFKRLLTEVSYR